METIAALAAPTSISSCSQTSLIGTRSGFLGERRVSCSLRSALVSGSRSSSFASAAALRSRRDLCGKTQLRFGLDALPQRSTSYRVAPRAASQENSEIKVEEVTEKLESQAEESKAAYSEAVDALKTETIKLQESSKGAYEPAAEKAIEVLRDTTEKLKEEAEKARAILTATAVETAELGKSNLSLLAESAPDPIKEIAATAVDAHLKESPRKGARIHDFCLGIPYGALLVSGGLLWFIITGSTAAIRFGVLLGGILLALSVVSLKVWKEGESSIPYIQGQAAIAFVIFVKDARRFFATGSLFPTAISALVSAGMLAFYAYVYLSGGNPPKKEKVAEPASAA